MESSARGSTSRCRWSSRLCPSSPAPRGTWTAQSLAVRAFEVYLHRFAQQEAAATLSRVVATGALDEQTAAELTQTCKTAAERFIKEHPEASLAER